MGKSSPSGSTTVTQNNSPWPGVSSYLTGTLYPKAQNIGNQPLTYFPNQTFANPTPQQTQAIGLQSQLATNDPVMQSATGGITPYLNGSMLSAGNPYLGAAFNTAAQAAIPQIQSGFEANGRYGSGAAANAQASALTNLAGQMAYQNYSDQSTNQLKAMLLAPQISQGNFADIGQLASAGAQQQAFNQLPITEAMNRFQFNQDAPFLSASRMAQLLGGAPTSSTQTQPYFSNPVGSALGTGIGALGLYNMFNNSGLGSSIGGGASSLWNSLFGSGMGADASSAAGQMFTSYY